MIILVDVIQVKLLKFRDKVFGVELPHIAEYTVVSIDSTKVT